MYCFEYGIPSGENLSFLVLSTFKKCRIEECNYGAQTHKQLISFFASSYPYRYRPRSTQLFILEQPLQLAIWRPKIIRWQKTTKVHPIRKMKTSPPQVLTREGQSASSWQPDCLQSSCLGACDYSCVVISRCCAGMRLRAATRAHDLHFARFVTAPAILYGWFDCWFSVILTW